MTCSYCGAKGSVNDVIAHIFNDCKTRQRLIQNFRDIPETLDSAPTKPKPTPKNNKKKKARKNVTHRKA